MATIREEDNALFLYLDENEIAHKEFYPSVLIRVDAYGRRPFNVNAYIRCENDGAVFGTVQVGLRADVFPELEPYLQAKQQQLQRDYAAADAAYAEEERLWREQKGLKMAQGVMA
jgi:hypothetical protein